MILSCRGEETGKTKEVAEREKEGKNEDEDGNK